MKQPDASGTALLQPSKSSDPGDQTASREGEYPAHNALQPIENKAQLNVDMKVLEESQNETSQGSIQPFEYTPEGQRSPGALVRASPKNVSFPASPADRSLSRGLFDHVRERELHQTSLENQKLRLEQTSQKIKTIETRLNTSQIDFSNDRLQQVIQQTPDLEEKQRW